MKNSTLKQIIKEEVRSALNEAESSELAKMAKEIKGVLDRKVAMPSFEKNTVATKEPTIKAVISDIEWILEKYK
jgi:hypothetical protein